MVPMAVPIALGIRRAVRPGKIELELPTIHIRRCWAVRWGTHWVGASIITADTLIVGARAGQVQTCTGSPSKLYGSIVCQQIVSPFPF